ncbi:MAG: hypothetical protein SFU27_06725 [Thermonemataceae bacterium]|nr:hypothetical protein [Thermonemataceae bacterium]
MQARKIKWQLLIALLSIFLWLWLSRKGLGLTTDARAYLYAAQSFREKWTLLTPFGYYTNWTPLFPLLLSILEPKILQSIAFFFNILLIYQLFKSYLKSPFLEIAFAQSILGTTFFLIHFFVWSEAWFLVFLLVLFRLFAHIQTSQYAWLGFILLSNALVMQRLAGIFFVLTFIILIALYWNWKKAVIYTFFANISLFFWYFRNYLIQKKPDFLDNIWVVSFVESWGSYAHTIIQFFFPFPVFLSILSLIIVCTALFLAAKKIPKISNIFVIQGFFLSLGYLLIIFFFRMNVTGESERYLSPIWVFLVGGFWYFLAESTFFKEKKYKIWLYALAALILLYNFLRTAKSLRQWIQNPPDLW